MESKTFAALVEWIGARLYGSVDVDDFAAAFVVGGLVDKCVEGLDVRAWGLEGFACGGGWVSF